MARSRSRRPASTVMITSNPKARSAAATSSASFLGLNRTRLGFLYWELPTTSATRRSAKAEAVESASKMTPHRAATHDRAGLLIAISGYLAFRVPYHHQMSHGSHRRIRRKGGRPVAVTVTFIGLE